MLKPSLTRHLWVFTLVLFGCDPISEPASEQSQTQPPSFFGLSEDMLHVNPSLYAGKHSVVVLRAEHPGSVPHERDIGDHGSDRIPYAFEEDIELEICAEQIAGVSYTLRVLSDSEQEVLRLEGGAGCASRTFKAGVYYKDIIYHASADPAPTVFLKPKYTTMDQQEMLATEPATASSDHADPGCTYVADYHLKTPNGFLAYTHRYVQDYNRFILRVDYPAMDGFSTWSIYNCGGGTFQIKSVATGKYLYELISGDFVGTNSRLFLESDVFEADDYETYSFKIRGDYDSAANTLSLWFQSTYGIEDKPLARYPYWYCYTEGKGAEFISANMPMPSNDRTHCVGNAEHPADTKYMRLGLIGPSKGVTVGGNCDGCNLSGIELFGFDLSNYSLKHAKFDNAHLMGSSFAGADLSSASFEGALLVYADFAGANLEQATLTPASAQYVNFGDASLKQASFTKADFSSSDAALEDKTFGGAAYHLKGCRLKSLDNDTGQVIQTGYVSIPDYKTFLFSSCPSEICKYSAQVHADPDLGDYEADCESVTAPDGTLNWTEVVNNFGTAKIACTDFSHADLSFNPTIKDAIKTNSYDCRNNFAHATVPPDFEQPENWRFLDLNWTHIQMLTPEHFGDSLAGLDYSEAMMAGINFSGFNLTSSIFESADLSSAKFIEADVSTSRFGGARLADAIFFGANLSSTDFSSPDGDNTLCTAEGYAPDTSLTYTDFHGANFKSVHAPDAKFNNAFLSNADFSDALLARADFGSAFLERCGPKSSEAAAVFDRATLDEATFDAAQLRAVSFKEASLNKVSFAHQSLDSNRFTSSQLSGADFTSAAISGADFSGAILFNANFNSATLSASGAGAKVDMAGTQLGGASFIDARFDAVDLSNALAPVKNICPADHILRPWSYWKYVGGNYQKVEVTFGLTDITGVVYQTVECPLVPNGGQCAPDAWLVDDLADQVCIPDPDTHHDDSDEVVFGDLQFETCLREVALRDNQGNPYSGKITVELAAETRHISCPNRAIGAVNGTTELVHFINLQTLDLSFNQLKELNLAPLAAAQIGVVFLTKLDLSHNQLTEIDLAGLKKVRYVNLESNRLANLVLYANLHLYSLDVSDNLLTEINLNFVPDLEYVDVSNNRLTSLANSTAGISNMVYLMYLSAANNDLTSIGDLRCLDIAFASKGDCTANLSGSLSGLDLSGNKNFDCASLNVSDRLLAASNCGH